jgi:phage shock protein A
MNLPEFAQISEENELLRDQIRELETELDDARHEINELKAQVNAKEEGATVHRQRASQDGWVWERELTIIEGEWRQLHEASA